MFVEGKEITVMAYFKAPSTCTLNDKPDKMMVVLPTDFIVVPPV
jgi:hypothetical protein